MPTLTSAEPVSKTPPGGPLCAGWGLPHNMAAKLNHKHSKKTSKVCSVLELSLWLSPPRLTGSHRDPPCSAEEDTDYPRIQGVLGSHCSRPGGWEAVLYPKPGWGMVLCCASGGRAHISSAYLPGGHGTMSCWGHSKRPTIFRVGWEGG